MKEQLIRFTGTTLLSLNALSSACTPHVATAEPPLTPTPITRPYIPPPSPTPRLVLTETDPNPKLKITQSCEEKEPVVNVELFPDRSDGNPPFYALVGTKDYPLEQRPTLVLNFDRTTDNPIVGFWISEFNAKFYPRHPGSGLNIFSAREGEPKSMAIGDRIQLVLGLSSSEITPTPQGPITEITIRGC